MRKIQAIVLAALFPLVTVSAQRIHRFTSGQTSDNKYQAICEDKSGFIWIGTENGLNRYDGYEFYKFFHDDEDSLSLIANYVKSLYVDNLGTLWIGTNRGLQYLTPGEKAFHTVRLADEGWGPYIQEIKQFRDGYIWIAAPGHGIFWIDPSHPDDAHGFVSLNNRTSQNSQYRHIIQDREGTIWIGTITGVLLYDPKTDNLTEFEADEINTEVTDLSIDPMGRIFITTNRHLYMWNPDVHQMIRLTPSEGIWEITHQFVNRNNQLMLSLRGNGLLILDQNLKLRPLDIKPSDRSLDKIDVSTFFHDHAGNYWLGCFMSDLILVSKDRNEFDYWKFSGYTEDISGTVTAMVTDSRGRLWVGYNNNGLICLNSQGEVLKQGAETPYVGCMFRDSRNRIWVGHPSGGLSLLNTHTGELMRVISNDYANISSITEDKQGRIYYSELGNGFSRYDPTQNDSVSEIYSDFANRGLNGEWISNDWVHTMFIDSQNRLWLGHDNGTDCFDIDENMFMRINRLRKSIGTAGCYCILEEHDGVIWFGTTKGILIYYVDKQEVKVISSKEGLTNDDIRGMLKDNDGNVWVCTSNGVNKINPSTLEVTRFYTEEKSFNRVSAISREGRIYFGSNSGITSFIPSDIKAESTVNKVIMTGFYLNGSRITATTTSGGKPITREPVNQTSELRLAYRDNSFTMEFSTLNYGEEMNIIYEYTFNLDRDTWDSNLAGVNRISFSKLRYGRYDLSVRARLNDIVSEPRTYRIHIEAPWYATTMAYCIYILLFLMFLMVIIRFRKRSREREMNETKFQSFINVAHEICAPMTMVISPLEDMLHDDTLPEEVQSSLRQMHKSSTRILTLINQLLDMRKYDEGQMQLHFAETDLINFLMGPFELYTQTAERHNINFHFNHAMAEQMAWIDRDSIDKVMMNLLSNAFKYTPDDGTIELSVEVGTDDSVSGPLHNYVQISVSDTGIGLDKEEMNKVFDRFYRADNKVTSVTMGMGIGLNYSQMLVHMHHGVIKAENRKDGKSGSIFSFRIPLGNKHIAPEDLVEAGAIARPQLDRSRVSMDHNDPENMHHSNCSLKVLLVDDDDSMLEYLTERLKMSYKIITARNGKEGLKLAVSQTPDLIITDVVMPEMDGIQLVKALKGNSLVSHIPVILLSGKNKLQDRMLGLDTGADSYLPKPFYISELKSLMANLINNRLIVKGKFSGKQEQTERVAQVQFESSDELFMKRVMAIVNKNISNSEFNISQMVDEVGMSRTQLHRKLKELTGFSASRFMQNIRMQQAMKLLKEKRVNVSQIAYSVGFSSQTHFSTTFKQYYGVSPTEYIKQLDEEQKGNGAQ